MGLRLDEVHHMDCVKGLARLEEGSVDLAFADPPFNIGYKYDVYDDRREDDAYLDWTRQWMTGVIRALKPDGTFWLAIGDEYAAEMKVLATRELGLRCRSWVIWYYTFGVHCTRKFTRSHAHLFHFVKDAKRFTFNAEAVRVPSARQLVYGDKRANAKGRMPDDTWIIRPLSLFNDPAEVEPCANGHAGQPALGDARDEGWVLRPQDVPDGFTPDSDTWYFSRVAGTFGEREGFHGCQMPEQLLGRIVRVSSNEGDLVLDPFAGSGTTLAVAKKLGRRFVGFELSTDYTRCIRTRLKATRPGDALNGPADPLRSAPATAAGRRRAMAQGG